MVNYREILRLRSLGYSITQIAAAVHSSRNTIRDVQQRATEHNLFWPVADDVTNSMLYEQLYPERFSKANVWMELWISVTEIKYTLYTILEFDLVCNRDTQ